MDALAGGAVHAGRVAVRATAACDRADPEPILPGSEPLPFSLQALEKRQEELQKELSARKYTLYKLQSRGSVAQTEAGRLQRLLASANGRGLGEIPSFCGLRAVGRVFRR